MQGTSGTGHSAKAPEGAVPQDERLPIAFGCRLHVAHANVVIAGFMDLGQLALEPGSAAVDQRQAIGAEVVRDVVPGGRDGGGAARKELGDELLGAGADGSPGTL